MLVYKNDIFWLTKNLNQQVQKYRIKWQYTL